MTRWAHLGSNQGKIPTRGSPRRVHVVPSSGLCAVSRCDVILRGQVTRVAYAGSLTEVAMTIDEYRLQRPHASVQ